MFRGATLAALKKHVDVSRRLAGRSPLPKELRSFVLGGHRVVTGYGFVIAYRAFEGGRLGATDTAAFTKVTILVKDGFKAGRGSVSLGRAGNVAFISEGAASFPQVGCVGYAEDGSVIYKWVGASMIGARLRFSAEMFNANDLRTRCQRLEFDRRLMLTVKDPVGLTPWEGAASSRWWEESHPSLSGE